MTRVGRNNNRDNWMLYWLSDAPSDWLLVKWINAETSWDVTVKDESDKLRGSFSKLLPHARDPFKQEQLHLRFFFLVCSLPPSLTSFLPSLSFVSLSLTLPRFSIAPRQTWWFIVAIHLLYSSITGRLLGDHGSSCLLLSSTEGPSVSGGRWKALRTRRCHAE